MYYTISRNDIDFGECPFPKDKKKDINDLMKIKATQNDDSNCLIE